MNRRQTIENIAAVYPYDLVDGMWRKFKEDESAGLFEFWMYALLKQAGINISVLEPGNERTPDFHAEDGKAECDIEVSVITPPEHLTDAESDLNKVASSLDYDGWFVSWKIIGRLTQRIARRKIEREFRSILASNPTKGEDATIFQDDRCRVVTTFVQHRDDSKGGIMFTSGSNVYLVNGPERIKKKLDSKYGQRRREMPYVIGIHLEDLALGDTHDIYTALFGDPEVLAITYDTTTGEIVDQKTVCEPGGFWTTTNGNPIHRDVLAVIFVSNILESRFVPDVRLILNPYIPDVNDALPASLLELPHAVDNLEQYSRDVSSAIWMSEFVAE